MSVIAAGDPMNLESLFYFEYKRPLRLASFHAETVEEHVLEMKWDENTSASQLQQLAAVLTTLDYRRALSLLNRLRQAPTLLPLIEVGECPNSHAFPSASIIHLHPDLLHEQPVGRRPQISRVLTEHA